MRRRATLAAVLALACAACAPIPLARESPFHASDAALGVTRVVHGSLVLELSGTRLLVDPWFHSGFFTRQGEPLGLMPVGLPTLGALLLTGDEPDRYDPRALAELTATVSRVIAPPALREQLVGIGFKDVTGLDWWEPTTVDGLTITAVPSGNGPRANGYVVVSHEARAYIAGATRTFPGLVDIAVAFPHLDVAILPIGGRRVFGVLEEMTPAQAADAARTLDAARVIPTGYGARSRSPITWYHGNALDEFRNSMAVKGLADRVVVLETGESWHWGGSQP
jgi:L-ascorbate metabolism protein UlaG (beta-lactamase superfamily)